jgi:DNA-binding response OmpR family regulator
MTTLITGGCSHTARRAGERLIALTEDRQTIVVIEDDPNISDLVAMYLRKQGYRVLQAEDAQRGLEYIERERPKLAIVDVGLPGELDGLDVCRKLGAEHGPPVVLLTARDDEVDRVLGLELGADDYVTKPFSPRELVARVRAVLRRTEGATRSEAVVMEVGPILVDTARREVRLNGEIVELTAREFELLAYLFSNHGLALSRRQLLDGAWGRDWYGDERTVDVHVRQLRKKLGSDLPLATVWGVGYRFG